MNPTYHDTLALWKDHLKQGLADDGWQWDWTTLGLLEKGMLPGTGGPQVKARVVAKADGVWAGDGALSALGALSAELGMPISVHSPVVNGAFLRKGETACEWRGPARMVLAAERPFLNLVSYAGGIATQTRCLVGAVAQQWKALGRTDMPPRVTSTRKTLPGFRDLAIHGVICGGGWSHRSSLAGGVLIKENHIASAGGIASAIEAVRSTAPHGLKIEIEVRDQSELEQALLAGVDGVMLDNFEPARVAMALAFISKDGAAFGRKTFVEISGGLHEENIGAYVMPGVDILSSGSLTHSVKATDLSLLIE